MVDFPDLADKEFHFTQEDFDYLSRLVHETTGINLTKDKRELVYGRLSKRLRQLGLKSFDEYCEIIRSNDGDEMVRLINAITTNVTQFFREIHHFEYMASDLLPELQEKRTGEVRPRLRIWSAGCSSGNEPYSIAMVLREGISDIGRWDVKILATDLDSHILDVADRGVYTLSNIDAVSNSRRKRWFKIGSGDNEGAVKIKDEIRDLVTYKQLNLMETWPMKGLFDVIFCRNVAIYFDKETRERIINRFADQLTIGGYLFVGHSETLFGVSTRFECVGKTIYRKVA